jgi:hypothetical protein
MPSTREVLACALALGLLATGPAFAATKPTPKLAKAKPVVITDKAGDANGINSQSHAIPADPSQSGQGGRTAADILSVSVGRLDDGKKVLGMRATFTLAAAPDQGTIYRIQSSAPACSTFWISYNFPVGGAPTASLRENCTGTAATTVLTTVKVVDKTITIDLPYKVLPKLIKPGTVLSGIFGETKGHAATPAANPTVPTIDDTVTSPDSYKVGA